MKSVEEPGIDLCDYCYLDEDKRGVTSGPSGPTYRCNSVGCEEAYANYLDEVEGVEMAKYRKKPVVIEAIRWSGSNVEEVNKFTNKPPQRILSWDESLNESVIISTLEGDMRAKKGDYIIKGVNGEFYPCKPDIFKKTYEKVEGKVEEV